MILIDNYDSFTYNIVQYLKELGVEPKIFKNDEITVSELKKLDFSSIIISPGPKKPDESGISMGVIGEFYKSKKILGICLGHQCIAQYFGCKIVKSSAPVHGKVSKIYFDENELFEGLEQGFEATRYHSLEVDNTSVVDCIVPLAFTKAKCKVQNAKALCRCEQKENPPANLSPYRLIDLSTNPQLLIMGLKHKLYPTYGVQFHPEAILTQGGKKLLLNFINMPLFPKYIH